MTRLISAIRPRRLAKAVRERETLARGLICGHLSAQSFHMCRRSATMRSSTAIILYSSTKYCTAQRHDHLIGVETLLHCDPFVCDDMSTEHCQCNLSLHASCTQGYLEQASTRRIPKMYLWYPWRNLRTSNTYGTTFRKKCKFWCIAQCQEVPAQIF